MKFVEAKKILNRKVGLTLGIVAAIAAVIDNFSTISSFVIKKSAKLVVERVLIDDPLNVKIKEIGSWKLKSYNKDEISKASSFFGLLNHRKFHLYEEELVSDSDSTIVKPIKLLDKPNDAGVFLYHLSWTFDNDELRVDFMSDEPMKIFPKRYMHLLAGAEFYNELVDPRQPAVQMNIGLYTALYENLGRDLKPPEVRIVIRNDGDKMATFYAVNSRYLYSYGGEAGAGGAELKPVNSDKVIRIEHSQPGHLKFRNPIVLDPATSTVVSIIPYVVDAALGDGPGGIIVNWTLDYHDGVKSRELNLGNFHFEDSVTELTTIFGYGGM